MEERLLRDFIPLSSMARRGFLGGRPVVGATTGNGRVARRFRRAKRPAAALV